MRKDWSGDLFIFVLSLISLTISACAGRPLEPQEAFAAPSASPLAGVSDAEVPSALAEIKTSPTNSAITNTQDLTSSRPTSTREPASPLPASTLRPTAQLPIIVKGVGQDTCYLDPTLRQEIDARASISTMGGAFSGSRQQQLALAYFDPAAALANMDNISWAVPNIPAPFVGHLPMPGQHGNAAINSMQFRYDYELQTPKPANTYRIFVTGGSTAYGSGAPSQDRTIAGYLSQLLLQNQTPVTGMQYEVINAANPAWASTHERILIENRLSELEPDMVISFSGNNDVHWGQAGRDVLWFRSYDDDIFLDVIDNAYTLSGYPPIPEITEIAGQEIAPTLIAERLLKNVLLSSYVLGLDNVDYVFVLQPTLPVTDKSLTARESDDLDQSLVAYFRQSYQLMDAALSSITASNFTYVNLAPMFDGFSANEEIFLDSYHFGDRGNAYIADAIYLQIIDLLP